MANEEIKLSFIFESFNLKNGDLIRQTSDDMKKYCESKKIHVVEDSRHVKNPVSYYDKLITLNPGEKYLSGFDWGEKRMAKDYMIRLKSIFENRDTQIWENSNIFQSIFDDVYNYAMEKGFFIGTYDTIKRLPKVRCYDLDFFILGAKEDKYISIDVDYNKKVMDYVHEKRKEHGARVIESCATCFANCTNKEGQTLKNIAEQNNLSL